MLDINIFRGRKAPGPDAIRKSQGRRFKSLDLVDKVIDLDAQWCQRQFDLEKLQKEYKQLNKEIFQLKIKDDELIKKAEEMKRLVAEKEAEVREALAQRNSSLEEIGNLVHDSVPISKDEANNEVIRLWGKNRLEPALKNHVELCKLLGIADFEKGAKVAGSRGYYIEGVGIDLHEALKNFALDFLEDKAFKKIIPPFSMRQDVMARCAQLQEFDDELYKVTGEGHDKYLIATAEQPLCALHKDEWFHPSQLPKKYVGFSYCFRTEAGSHGRDTLGLFRTHEFAKVEQFCITSPNENDSWDMHEEMILNSEEFYTKLKIPYCVVNVVSGALNGAAAKKYDLEGWFPASQTYRELVSCSNCTDYQSRKLEIRYGQTGNEKTKQYVHMLNSTLTAIGRTMCCILENYQRKDGVEVPEVLRQYMRGKIFLPFENKPCSPIVGCVCYFNLSFQSYKVCILSTIHTIYISCEQINKFWS